MKTINLKTAFKLSLLALILCSTKVFSFTKIPSEASSKGSESRTCFVNKATKSSKTASKTYSTTSKGYAMQSKAKKFFKK
ncbi:hypothetical protein HKT18_02710 [Flavobacterium sp. IMCC34852]|uniref:Uncharacterized protein n=1 Tax=Flavobacterium rivulicola TaxID=2732161 RepID=A0A7Y3VXZ5_9FLAO|nr:hypothetical protein [Flavobacterium sp. IMCC34852]NNT71118.1 hypothetical protein [Flavobacterium sp. IMCC34852]